MKGKKKQAKEKRKELGTKSVTPLIEH